MPKMLYKIKWKNTFDIVRNKIGEHVYNLLFKI